ncbi:MAG: GNAT family N-acetyltransferase [Paracoccaceae bacterium]
MTAVEIRPAGPEDRAALIRFMARLQDFEREIEPNRRPGDAMAEAHMAALLAWVAAAGGGCLVAEELDGAGAVGFVLFGVETEIGDYVLPENRRVGRISDLWVEPGARGQGVARRLLQAAEEALAALGICRVEVSALPDNRRARAFYEAAGFSPALLTLAKRIA